MCECLNENRTSASTSPEGEHQHQGDLNVFTGSKNPEKMLLNNDHRLITPLLNNSDDTDTAFNIGIEQQYAIFALMGSAPDQRPANERFGGLNLNCRSQSTPYGDVKKTPPRLTLRPFGLHLAWGQRRVWLHCMCVSELNASITFLQTTARPFVLEISSFECKRILFHSITDIDASTGRTANPRPIERLNGFSGPIDHNLKKLKEQGFRAYPT
ncbi:hypothetical protein PV325_008787 [Microctonus aethiopoides]|nr:hypothetical protein PV325_008787 [Microctonus aethiopoides]